MYVRSGKSKILLASFLLNDLRVELMSGLTTQYRVKHIRLILGKPLCMAVLGICIKTGYVILIDVRAQFLASIVHVGCPKGSYPVS